MRLYNMMLNKQQEINVFERNLLKLPSFENVNNNENNEFIKSFNSTILEYERDNKVSLNNKQMIMLKRKMYKEYYTESIKKVNVIRISDDKNFKAFRNPDLVEVMDKTEYKDASNKTEQLLKEGLSFADILKSFKISKEEIVKFQANFTPIAECNMIISQSRIAYDTRTKIMVLEPTAGIGNIITELLKVSNVENLYIDCNEFHQLFFNIGKSIFKDIDNIKWSNIDFQYYETKYNYDYILGNPPFNLRTQRSLTKGDNKGKPVDTVLYDVHFVSMAYNMLSMGGNLTMIISDRFLRDKKQPFKKFNEYLKLYTKNDADSVIINKVGEFKKDKTITKEMTTKFGMVCITIKKLVNNTIMKLDGAELDDNGRKVRKEPLEKQSFSKATSSGLRPDDEPLDDEPKKKPKNKVKLDITPDEPKNKVKLDITPDDEPKKFRSRRKIELDITPDKPNITSVMASLQKLILMTPIKTIQKALNSLKYKERLQTNKILMAQQLLQNFNTIDMMIKLRDAINPDLIGTGVFDFISDGISDAYSYVKQKYEDVKADVADRGSAVLTRTNYVGPFNRLDDEYIRTHPPVDIIDEGAMKHDLEYSRIAKLRDDGKINATESDNLIRKSDIAFLDNIRDNWKVNPWASALGYAGINNKNLLEDYVGLDKNLFVGQGKEAVSLDDVLPQYWNRMGVSPEEARRAKMTLDEKFADDMLDLGSKVKGMFGGGQNHSLNGLKLHAVIIKKPYDLEKAKQTAASIINDKKKKFYRETDGSYRFRNIPKTKFIKKSFRTKKINSNISLIFGLLGENNT